MLWIIRIKAAAEIRGLSYSRFIHGLSLANLKFNRKVLSEVAIREPKVFDELIQVVTAALSAAERACNVPPTGTDHES